MTVSAYFPARAMEAVSSNASKHAPRPPHVTLWRSTPTMVITVSLGIRVTQVEDVYINQTSRERLSRFSLCTESDCAMAAPRLHLSVAKASGRPPAPEIFIDIFPLL
jgi:hypothetical protein